MTPHFNKEEKKYMFCIMYSTGKYISTEILKLLKSCFTVSSPLVEDVKSAVCVQISSFILSSSVCLTCSHKGSTGEKGCKGKLLWRLLLCRM